MSFETTVSLNYGAEKKTSSTKYRALGTRGVTPDGRIFYWAENGATALTSNRIAQSKLAPNQVTTALVPSTAAGDWSGSNIATGSVSIGVVWVTAHASGEFNDGYLTVETTPGGGMYRIAEDGDSVTGSSNTVTVIRLHPDDPIQVAALTTVSILGLSQNPYASVIVAPATTLTALPIGVAPVNVPADEHFWCQTYGPAAIHYDAGVAAVAGDMVRAGGATAGDVIGVAKNVNTEPSVDAVATVSGVAATNAKPRIGVAMEGIPGDGDLLKVMLTIRA
jgi:hypothetical protein